MLDPSPPKSPPPESPTWAGGAVDAILSAVPDGIILAGADSVVLAHNPAAATLLGADGSLVGDRIVDWALLGPDGRTLSWDEAPASTTDRSHAAPPSGIVGVRRPGRPTRWVRLSVSRTPPACAAPEDIAERPLTVIHLERATAPTTGARLPAPGQTPARGNAVVMSTPGLDVDALFRQGTVGLVRLAVDGTIAQINEAAARMFRTPAADLLGRRVRDLVHPDDYAADLPAVLQIAAGDIDHHGSEVRVRTPDGWAWVHAGVTAFHDEDGRLTDVVGLLVDPSGTHERDVADPLLTHDPLTGLRSRRDLLDLLERRLAEGGAGLAVMALNLDRFRAVNDGLGQTLGDQVLVALAHRLGSLLTTADTAARLGGDDFVIVFDEVSTRSQAGALADRVLDEVREPLDVDGLTITLTASMGVALSGPPQLTSADEVIMHAATALAAAKRNGRARYEMYDDDLALDRTRHLRIETWLRNALDSGQLTVAYQPIGELRTGSITGAEALIRWVDPRLGTIGPETFVPIAQDAGLVGQLTTFVLGHALEAVAGWRRRSGADVGVAVNLTAQDLTRRGLAHEVAEALGHHGLPPRCLRLEIIETVLVDVSTDVRRNLEDLHQLGVQLGIDDFGTGYASMAYLKHLPVSFVKIDRSFVTGLGSGRVDTAIVRAVIALAASLELTVIAEGIETEEQREILLELGCDLGQGFLIGHAEPARRLAARLPRPVD